MAKDKTQTNDILDQVKRAERAIKMNLLIKRLAKMKEIAREVLVAKETMNFILEDIGVSDEDKKRIIDYVNSSPEVQLTEKDKEEIREEVKDDGVEVRKEIQKKIENSPQVFTMASLGNFGGGGGGGGVGYGTGATGVSGDNFNYVGSSKSIQNADWSVNNLNKSDADLLNNVKL